ncbi:MAG: class I SAM-dependent methyltransferase [Oscillospiraceae bacterium]|nr:class I SAM-dependent methyltransferase [Oscillospiraceae bacterium]
MNEEQQKINAHWTKGSENYDRIIHDELKSFRMEGWQRLIAEQVGSRPGLDVLDCGCGPAFFTIILSKAGYRVTGIDAAEGMLEKARKNTAEYGVDAQILEMDCHEPAFPDDSFDLVVSRNVTHALRDHVRAYSEWLRVLRPGGTLLIFDANWHLAMSSEAWFRESMEREKKCIELYGSDFSGNTTFDEERSRRAYESERHHRLGDLRRPDWDCGLLTALGYRDITYDRDITGPLWDDKEKLIYGHTPMFMIRARKGEAGA